MCTAATFTSDDFYFGRTLDNNFSYGEEIIITPRQCRLDMRHDRDMTAHFAIIGMGLAADGFPLYYDAINEKGLCMAGLNFVGNAVYNDVCCDKTNVAQFEFIPFILGKCASVEQARKYLSNLNLTNTPFSDKFPVAELHWIIADKNGAIVVESTAAGLNVYDDPAGVLTNNPTFPEQMFALNNFMNLSPKQPKNNFCGSLNLCTYSNGMGALGLPGDLSSQSRFVRAAYTKLNSSKCDCEESNVGQFFHIMDTVLQTNGCCIMADGSNEYTVYTSCCNADKGIYYYSCYNNRQITAVDMNRVNLDGCAFVRYPLVKEQQIKRQN